MAALAPTVAPAGGAERLEGLAREHFVFIWRLLRRLGLPADAADDGAHRYF